MTRARAGAAGLVVEGDGGGQADEALKDTFAQAGEGAGVVAFEREDALAVQKMLSMRWRIGARWTARPGSSRRRGRTTVASSSLTAWAKARPA